MEFQQLSIFDIYGDKKETYKVRKPVRLIELFAGIGSQAMALKTLKVPFEHYRVVEFDKYAIKSYNAIHGTSFPTTDIRNIHGMDLGIVEPEKYCYILTYSFPCTDLSVAGKMKGMSKKDWLNGESTRSGLLWEVERLLDETPLLPQIMLMENVPQVHSSKNKEDWEAWLNYLESKGYSSYWQDLNAKDYGVAQSRNRTICISILGNYDYKFPEKIKLDKCMGDYLEDKVDEKFYINTDKAKKLIDKLIAEGKLVDKTRQDKTRQDMELICPTVTQNSLTEKCPASRQDTMVESTDPRMSVPESLRKCVSMNNNMINQVDTDVAVTLCSRDYKGFSSGYQFQNGVMEYGKSES